jgi:hypothetical protein
LRVSAGNLEQTMSFPDPQGFRMHTHEICNDAYRIKRFLLYGIHLLYILQNSGTGPLKLFFEVSSIEIKNKLSHPGRNFYRVKQVC